jgi:TPR repeat protein
MNTDSQHNIPSNPKACIPPASAATDFSSSETQQRLRERGFTENMLARMRSVMQATQQKKSQEIQQSEAEEKFRLAERLWKSSNLNQKIHASELLREAADQGHPQASYFLARILWNWNGIPRDVHGAYRYMNYAATHNVRMANLLLGEMYRTGVGCTVDVNCAIQCWANYDFTILKRNSKRNHGYLQQIDCLKERRERNIAQFNYADSLFALGKLFDSLHYWSDWAGDFLNVVRVNASFTCMQSAASFGHLKAKLEMGRMCLFREQVLEDTNLGIKCIREAADAGLIEAIDYLQFLEDVHPALVAPSKPE